MKHSQRIIIIGAGGFLGRNITEYLSGIDMYQIIAITQGADQFRKTIDKLSQVIVLPENALNTKDMILDNEDLMINCAYPRGMQGTNITLGLDYIEEVFSLAAKASIKGIINVSSQSVYNPEREKPATEEDMPDLQSIYAVGKYCVEKLLNNICDCIPHTNIRLASLIGPGFDDRVPNKMVRSALLNREIVIQDSKQVFGYLDVKDAAYGFEKLLSLPVDKWKAVYNMGPDTGYTLIQIAKCIQQVLSDRWGLAVKLVVHNAENRNNSMITSSLLKNDIGNYVSRSMESSMEVIIQECLQTGIT